MSEFKKGDAIYCVSFSERRFRDGKNDWVDWVPMGNYKKEHGTTIETQNYSMDMKYFYRGDDMSLYEGLFTFPVAWIPRPFLYCKYEDREKAQDVVVQLLHKHTLINKRELEQTMEQFNTIIQEIEQWQAKKSEES